VKTGRARFSSNGGADDPPRGSRLNLEPQVVEGFPLSEGQMVRHVGTVSLSKSARGRDAHPEPTTSRSKLGRLRDINRRLRSNLPYPE